MSTYQVDPDELAAFAARLRHVHAAISAQSAPADDGRAAALGSAKLADALAEVSANWGRRRTEVLARLDGLARGLDAAAQAYAGTDAGVRQAAATADVAA
ncbi:MAG: hypothetical protein M3Q27_07675, partial [Actinomycetota bacterium]|nr:hypothetical protein [Actinomycetota bacterium]